MSGTEHLYQRAVERRNQEIDQLGNALAAKEAELDAAIQEAVEAERERCRREMVEPLMDALLAVQRDLVLAKAMRQFGESDALDVPVKTQVQIEDAIAAVERIQKNQLQGTDCIRAAQQKEGTS